MFRRNKKNRLDRRETASSNKTVTQTLGELAVPEAAPRKSYVEELRARTRAMRKYEEGFLVEALEKGVPSDEMPALVADAMNAGVLPRIARGLSFRGSGFSLILLDGTIPPEALRVRAQIDEQGYFDGEISIREESGNADDKRPKDMGYSIEYTELLPQTDRGDPVDAEMLAKIDAHMPAGYNPGEPEVPA